MKTPIIKTEDVIKGEETEEVIAIFSKKALKELRIFHQAGLKSGSWDLDEPHFIAWMAAVGVVGCNKGKKEENENEKRIKELEAEVLKLKKAKK